MNMDLTQMMLKNDKFLNEVMDSNIATTANKYGITIGQAKTLQMDAGYIMLAKETGNEEALARWTE